MSEHLSLAPTEPIPHLEEDWSDPSYYKDGDQIGYDKYFDIEIRSDGAEFNVGDVTYNYLGRTENGYMEFTSEDATGMERSFLVYVSNSEGSHRVSQGMETYERDGETKLRLMKGPEDSKDKQYTQDTQLHPEFDAKMDRLTEIRELRNLPIRPTPVYDKEGADWYTRDFEAQVTTYPIGSSELHNQLKELEVSRQSVKDIAVITGFDPVTEPELADRAYMRKVQQLNETLKRSGVMPDFSGEPTRVQLTSHPVLGNMIRETFQKTVGGQVYEWQMARDQNGRSWIERIRFADAEPSAYGTDKQLVYSGLLTSKPMDYHAQADGLPNRFTTDMGNGYTDVSVFLKELAPIKEYDKYSHSRDQYYHFMSVA